MAKSSTSLTEPEDGGALLLIRQHEPWVEELSVQLQFEELITGNGSVLTLPAATADLLGWVGDQRVFLPVQHDDWQQVIGDYSDSLKNSGPKLLAVVATQTTAIDVLLPNLISSSTDADGSIRRTMDGAVRTDLQVVLQQLATTLSSDEAIIASWRDLVKTCEKRNRQVEEVSFRRDTLWAIASVRNLDSGRFGIFRDVDSVLTDVADAVKREQCRAAGTEYHQGIPDWEPSGLEAWQRLPLCEQILIRPPTKADCIVWLRLAPTHLPQYEVNHGDVTFYNASYLSGHVGHPELADNFKVPPMEVLALSEDLPLLRPGEVEWEDDWNMAYARVVLLDTEVHEAEAQARTLIETLKVVNHAEPGTWQLKRGCIKFVDGRRTSFSWGPAEDVKDPYYPQNDRLGRDIERMNRRFSNLTAKSVHALQDAIDLTAALKAASDEGPIATVMAAVRAIEHVNVWTSAGEKHWADFASSYFKKAQARVRMVEFIGYFTRNAVERVPDHRPGAPSIPDLAELRDKLSITSSYGHGAFDVRGAADHVSTLKGIYADHWLNRGLGELETVLASPPAMFARLDELGRRFERHLRRLKRLRNAAIHGGPVSAAGCRSVETFAYNLGHQVLNEAFVALLTGSDVRSHMDNYRQDHYDRYERVRTSGDIDALFVVSEP
ncbi:hypothetical protein C0J29_14510 [Mycobacterium paragordonae]|uniref:ApeA N-terminal domain-containing protein n=1 Tax=Mycobacterium paragordonae TaxID=1389713 RepID=A0ABQ1C3W1_9MYCO|nr:hypothetical protein C0J29_14510 [Mycobacterium paragordonae]GFG79135.1 hypothetical protein MPRG_24110 [Mycobacterium paragordonae]